ncbi:MAG: hypothetical protein ACHQJ6_04925 [Candidatus Berkiellales bacterium]
MKELNFNEIQQISGAGKAIDAIDFFGIWGGGAFASDLLSWGVRRVATREYNPMNNIFVATVIPLGARALGSYFGYQVGQLCKSYFGE